MKKSTLLLLALWMGGTLSAQPTQPAMPNRPPTDGQPARISETTQTPQAATAPAAMQRHPQTGAIMAKPERYLYAELIGSHLPSCKGDGVILDFGQSAAALNCNWITDEKGRKILFNSMVEALNYMIRQRWEFVQAYTSGNDNDKTHYLLRIRTEEIPDRLRSQLPPPPVGTDAESVACADDRPTPDVPAAH